MIAKLTESIGKGLFAGVFGTAAMTVSTTLEMKLRGREELFARLRPFDPGSDAQNGSPHPG